MPWSRREVLASLSAVATGSLAGCTSPEVVDTSPPWEKDFDEATIARAREVGIEAQRAVVKLHVDAGISRQGTGWHVGDGQIVTNAHVLPAEGSGTVEISWLREDRTRSTERVAGAVLGRNDIGQQELDLGLVDSSLSELPALPYKDSSDLSKGDPLITIGHPMGAPEWIILLGPFFQYGVEGITTEQPWPTNAQVATFLPTREGNSGAPLLTLEGEVVGCHWGGSTTKELLTKDPDYVHAKFSNHPGVNLSVHSTVFEEHFIDGDKRRSPPMSGGRHQKQLSRRHLMRALGAGIVGSVAGCQTAEQRDSLDPDRGPFSGETVQEARAVANEAEKAVVTLTELQERTLGTAWHIGDGYLLTNAHNVEPTAGQPRVQVGPYPGSRDYDATLLGKERTDGVDLALLEAPVADRPSLSFASSTELSAGQPLVSVGHPRGVGSWITMLGSFHEYHEYPDTEYDIEERPREIRSFTSSRKGASGSPTLTLDGTVVGCLYGGWAINSEVAPREVSTELSDFPMATLHVDASVFDAYISKWT